MTRVVITGSSAAASWTIRGEQLGRAMGAYAKLDASSEELRSADVVVAVKRIKPALADRLRQCGRPVVWDALDFYDQTDASGPEWLSHKAWTEAERIGAKHIVGATRQMAEDLKSPLYVYHHGWNRGVAPVRPRVQTVAYEGAEAYIADVRQQIADACSAHNAKFVVNPANYLDADVVVAWRAGRFDTYASRYWKSNVKLANAQIAGLPFIGPTAAGYEETKTRGDQLIASLRDLGPALDRLTYGNRREISLYSRAFSVDAIAALYRHQLERLL